MSLKNPQSEIRLFNVPWQPNDNNWLLWDDNSSQDAGFTAYFNNQSNKYSGSNYNIIKEGVIKIDCNSYKINKFNYMMFKNPDIDSARTWWYAFIDRIEWLSYNTCAVHYHLDAWQCYQHNITFKKCFIERAHVPRTSAVNDWLPDVAGNYLAPEPISVSPQVEREISDFSTTGGDNPETVDWTPTWVLHSTSKYNNSTHEYEYSGTGTGESVTAEYGTFVSNPSQIQDIIQKYGRLSPSDALRVDNDNEYSNWIADLLTGQTSIIEAVKILATTSIADMQDHRNELIGLYAIPTWVKGSSTGQATNNIVHKNIHISLNPDTLAVRKEIQGVMTAYTPKNKKMLTSLCKGYALYTRNGFKLPLKPELFTSDNPIIGLYGHQLGIDSYLIHIGSYRNSTDAWHRLNYSCQSRLGYDANTGLDKTLNQLSTAIGAIGTVAGIAGNTASGNWQGVISGAGNAVNNSRNMIDALGQRGVNTGSSGNLLSITGNRPIPTLVDVSPNWAECEYIDDYLSVYGYSIEEIKTVNITSRSSWNYMKVAKLNAQINAPDEYASVIKNAFESGVHIWHTSIANVGNFGLSNN